jgi:capsular polysaccharide biosynthesis protein
MLLQRLGGVATIIISFAGLALISHLEPPTFVQIIMAFIVSIACLIGIVFLFAEGLIWTKEGRGKGSSQVI